jgi:predicted TIM-barrel fold metal-dependent hydrolase
MFPLGWVKPPLDRNFLLRDYLEAIAGKQVTKAIYMEVGVPEKLKEKEARWALDLCRIPGNLTVGAVISGDPSQKGFESYMKGFDGDPYLKGIRYSLRNVELPIPDTVVSNIRMLGRLGLSMDMILSTGKMEKGMRILDLCPDVRFILDHCGNPDPVAFFPGGKERPRDPRHDRDQWYRNIELVAERPNVICKVSGIVDNVTDYPLTASDLAPIIDHCLDMFGPDRVIFGGDWPVCLRNMSLGGWIDLLREVVSSRPESEQRKLFFDNARDFYNVDAGPG